MVILPPYYFRHMLGKKRHETWYFVVASSDAVVFLQMTPSAYPAAVGDVSSNKASGSRRWNCHELVSRQHGRFSGRLDPANRCIIQPPMIFFALVNFAPADEVRSSSQADPMSTLFLWILLFYADPRLHSFLRLPYSLVSLLVPWHHLLCDREIALVEIATRLSRVRPYEKAALNGWLARPRLETPGRSQAIIFVQQQPCDILHD